MNKKKFDADENLILQNTANTSSLIWFEHMVVLDPISELFLVLEFFDTTITIQRDFSPQILILT